MDWIFGKPLDHLTLEDLRAFLNDAGDEPLTWELKGDEKAGRWVRREQVIENVCGFANSDRGGVLLVGGHKRKGAEGWDLPGLSRPQDEPGPLLEKWVRTGFIRPPRTQVKVWNDGDLVAAAVAVSPTPDPPCVTRDGQVFQRTSGETVAVRDPVAMARLVDAGRNAWQKAHIRVERTTTRLLTIGDPRPDRDWELTWHPVILAVAVSSTGLPADVEVRPFIEGTAKYLETVSQALPKLPYDARLAFRFINQETHAWTALHFHRGWTVMLDREGAAGVGWHHEVNESDRPSLAGIEVPLRQAWEQAVELHSGRIGGSGRGRLRVLAHGALGKGMNFHVDRAIELEAPTNDEVDGVAREIRRAVGDPTATEPKRQPAG